MSSNNVYYCTKCGSQATKPPCERGATEPSIPKSGWIGPSRKAQPIDQATLGTWSCPKCGKGVSVKRQRLTPKKEVAA